MTEPTALIELGQESEMYPGFHSATIRCSEGDHAIFTSYRESYGDAQEYADRVLKDHLDQHKPGRALNIEVSWEVVAYCSVCEDGFGHVVQQDEGLACNECGTTWDMDGEMGELKESDDD